MESLYLTNIGLSYTYLHEYDSAVTYHQLAIDAMPGWRAPYNNKIETLILKYGNTKEAWSVLDTAVKETGDKMIEWRIKLLIYDKKYKEALDITENATSSDFEIKGNKFLYLAKIYQLLNNSAKAAEYADSSLFSYNRDLVGDKVNYEVHGSLGIAYALKGNSQMALEEAGIAIGLAKKNILNEIDCKVELARIYTILRDYNNAFMLVDTLLNSPSCISVKLLQLDPLWKPLTESQQYRTLIKKNSRN